MHNASKHARHNDSFSNNDRRWKHDENLRLDTETLYPKYGKIRLQSHANSIFKPGCGFGQSQHKGSCDAELWVQVGLGEREMEEAALKDGEYVGVRRFLRILESGSDAKALTDRVVDTCGSMVNLRTAIMRYRKPQGSSLFYRQASSHPTYFRSWHQPVLTGDSLIPVTHAWPSKKVSLLRKFIRSHPRHHCTDQSQQLLLMLFTWHCAQEVLGAWRQSNTHCTAAWTMTFLASLAGPKSMCGAQHSGVALPTWSDTAC